MKAPDKIFLPRFVYEKWLYQTSDTDDETEVEYIRKDALLEKIKERLKLYDPDDPDAEIACRELLLIISWLDGKEVAE